MLKHLARLYHISNTGFSQTCAQFDNVNMHATRYRKLKVEVTEALEAQYITKVWYNTLLMHKS